MWHWYHFSNHVIEMLYSAGAQISLWEGKP